MIQITVDTKSFAEQMDEFARNQMPYTTSLALNRTAQEFQDAMREQVKQRFHVREENYILNSIMIRNGDFATKEKLEVIVQVNPQRNLLAKFEEGTTLTSSDPTHPLYMPTFNLRADPMDKIARGMYPKALRLLERGTPDASQPLAALSHTTKKGVLQIQGKRRTFVLDATTMQGVQRTGVFQRYGPGKHDFKMIWTYTTHIQVTAKLGFYALASKIVDSRFALNFAGLFNYAMSTAR